MLRFGDKVYSVDPDGMIETDTVYEVRGTDANIKGDPAVWLRELGANGLPIGRPLRWPTWSIVKVA